LNILGIDVIVQLAQFNSENTQEHGKSLFYVIQEYELFEMSLISINKEIVKW